MRKELPKYSGERETDFDLVTKLPSDWYLKRLKFLMPNVTVGIVITPSKYYVDSGVPAIRSLNVKEGRVVPDELVYFSAHDNERLRKTQIHTGDIVIVRTGQTGASAVVDTDSDGWNCIDLIIVRRSNRLGSRFLQYFFSSRISEAQVFMNSDGAIQQHFNIGLVRELLIVEPPRETQRAIVSFLDAETGKLDRLLGVRRKQIDVLREQRAAVIHHAVTQGLDPTAPRKDSGIEWLGEIPEHWEVRRLKFASSCNMGSLTEKTPPDYELRYIDIGNVNSRGKVADIQDFVFSSAPNRARRRLSRGCTIISTVRTYLKAIAFFPDPDEDLIVSTGFAVLEPSRLLEPQFLFHLLASEYFIQTVIAESKGVGYPAINASDLVNIKIAFPERQEQTAILAHLDCETAKIDTLIGKYERELELLAEYRSSLISHAVTGKIDVRGLVDITKEQKGTTP